MSTSVVTYWLLIFGGFINTEIACRNGYPTVQREYRESLLVFVGTVTRERQEPSEKKPDGFYDGITYTLRVDEVFKGQQPQKTAQLFSENSNSRYPMKKGQRYLIFAYRDGGRYSIDSCGNSEPFKTNSNALRIVRKLAAAKH